MSHHLSWPRHEHVVLERGRVAERRRSERWESPCFQAPNWNMRLPRRVFKAADPDAFAPRDEVFPFLKGYALSFDAPLR